MERRILVATDGTGGSLGALRIAAALARRDHVTPLVITAAEPVMMEGSVLYAMPGLALALSEHPEAEAAERIRAQLRTLGPPAASWEPEVVAGPVAATVARLAEERGAGLILVGLPRHTRRERLLGGDTALEVVRLSRVPVLAVAPRAVSLPARAVVAVDFSEYSRDATRTLLDVLAEDAEVRLAHVAWPGNGRDDGTWTATYRAGARTRLEELARELRSWTGVRIQCEVLEGRPSGELLALAERTGAEVIAAGSHGHGFFTRLVTGSVSIRLLREASCSVLVASPRAASPELRWARAGRGSAHTSAGAGWPSS